MKLAHLIAERPAPPRFRTLADALEAAARSSDGLVFCDSKEVERPLSYADLLDRARRAAGGLRALGVRRGDRVGIVLPTGPDFMDAFFGTLLAGGIPVPLYPPVRLARLEEYHGRTVALLQAVGARLLLTDGRIWTLLGEVAARTRLPLGVVRIAELPGKGPFEERLTPDEPALIQFSSGTTVDPKPVVLTHENVLSNVAAIDSFIPSNTEERQSGVSWLPLYHDMGLIGCLFLGIVHPGSLTLLPPEAFLSRPALWLRAISRHHATVSVAPNFAFGLCLKRIRDEDLADVDLSSWRMALTGAEPVSAPLLRRFAQRFRPFGFDERALVPVYGLSEASLAVTFAPPGRPLRTTPFQGREVVSLGAPVPGCEVRIGSPEGETLTEGTPGEVLVRGPSVMKGYFGNPEASARALLDGWLRTGDLGFVEDGALYLSGRAKDVVIVRGQNHAPQEFEEALDGLPGVRAGCVAAVGVIEGDAEELALLVEIEGGPSDGLAEAVRGRVVERTSVRPAVVRLLAPGTLPRTSSGKLRRAEALRQLQARELEAARVTRAGLVWATARSLLGHLRARLP